MGELQDPELHELHESPEDISEPEPAAEAADANATFEGANDIVPALDESVKLFALRMLGSEPSPIGEQSQLVQVLGEQLGLLQDAGATESGYDIIHLLGLDRFQYQFSLFIVAVARSIGRQRFACFCSRCVADSTRSAAPNSSQSGDLLIDSLHTSSFDSLLAIRPRAFISRTLQGEARRL